MLHHAKLGGSKEEFLKANAPLLTTCSTGLVLLTDSSVHSPFIFQEVLFADWLGKKLLTAVFSNMWPGLKPSLKAVLGKSNRAEQISQLLYRVTTPQSESLLLPCKWADTQSLRPLQFYYFHTAPFSKWISYNVHIFAMPNVNYLSTSTPPVQRKEVKSQVENFRTPHWNLDTE